MREDVSRYVQYLYTQIEYLSDIRYIGLERSNSEEHDLTKIEKDEKDPRLISYRTAKDLTPVFLLF